MVEKLIQKVSLVGQVIQDLIYEPLRRGEFGAELLGTRKAPEYKQDGFFVFSDLPPGEYTLQIVGEGFQGRERKITIPFAPLILDTSGDNELAVIVKTINGGSKIITFDPIILQKEIRVGATVLATGFSTKLSTGLDAGEVSRARLENTTGLAVGSIVRIIRDKSIRLKLSPYFAPPVELTRIVGKVVNQNDPQVPLDRATVRLVKVNAADVILNDVSGVKIATVDVAGSTRVLGSEIDVATLTNPRGDYNLYFRPGPVVGNATFEASLPGYQTQSKTIPIIERARNRADFELLRS